jgi:hypothetical protein
MYLVHVLGRVAREIRDVARARTATHGHLRDRIAGLLLVTVGVDLICAVLALLFEHHAKQTQIASFGSALFWTSTQLLTVSSSLQNPITTAGRVLDVGMELYAITIIGALAGSMGSFLVKRSHELEEHAEQKA